MRAVASGIGAWCWWGTESGGRRRLEPGPWSGQEPWGHLIPHCRKGSQSASEPAASVLAGGPVMGQQSSAVCGHMSLWPRRRLAELAQGSLFGVSWAQLWVDKNRRKSKSSEVAGQLAEDEGVVTQLASYAPEPRSSCLTFWRASARVPPRPGRR